MKNRHITWRRWATYLVIRLLLAAFTIVILEAVSETTKDGFAWLALVPTIGVLLIPYRVPRQRKNPIDALGMFSVCTVLVALAAWPWYWHATATAPSTPTAVITSQNFTVDAHYGAGAGCVGLVDDNQGHWYTGNSLLKEIESERVTLYLTEFGWTSNSHPTQSPSAFLNRPHLDQFAYTLTPVTQDSCQKYPTNGQ